MFAESVIALSALLVLRETPPPNKPAAIYRSLPVARYVPGAQPPSKKADGVFGVETSARAALVMDAASGQTLYEKNAGTAYPIASLTKLMTAMTLLDMQPDMQGTVTITKDDEPKEAKAVFLEGEVWTQTELLQSLLIGSVNTAGNALARVNGGQERFVLAMNAKARSLGMAQARFVDPMGLAQENRASARDVGLALRAALAYPDIRRITETDKLELKSRMSHKVYVLKNTNLLLDSFLNHEPYRVLAAKTGSLPEAGYCLAQATRYQNSHDIIAVVLGSDNHFSRFQDAKALTAWTFGAYVWPTRKTVPNSAMANHARP